jgi:hypothetical protein
MSSNEKFPVQPTLIFQGGDASPEEIEQWINEQESYEETVSTVLKTIILGSIFQFFTFGMMLLAFWIIDTGLNNPLN